RSVLRDDGGMARKVLADMPGQQPAIGVVAIAGGREPDQQLDLLAGERHRLGGLRARRHGEYRDERPEQQQAHARRDRIHAYSAARSMRMESRCATTSSTCMTSA